MIVEFETIKRERYEELKKEILNLFSFVRVKRNKQNYALGGFSITPKDYDNGLTSEQIDKISDYLQNLKIDTGSLDILKKEVYEEGQGKFTGTLKNHLCFKDGFHFLKKIKDIIK